MGDDVGQCQGSAETNGSFGARAGQMVLASQQTCGPGHRL